ncbi:serine protease [Streptacidiphilus sp. PB12-B1b]|uniref:serine protease n=1 Tax=Streptacidiphilus sp. PB12-B1b TaxID=2705012 RepID=UPI0015FB8A37|nr:serine protease [Streptacidiphilus sp. PB12-B1b]QMU78817.1 serine protease [Streptacidiphilus sp. PB12-B1b]
MGDLAGRARGTAFHVDHQGTLLTSHEVVDGLPDLLLTWPGGATRRLDAADVTPLPELGLALLHTDAVLPPLPLAVGRGTRLVSLPLADHALQGGITAPVTARYAATDRWHLIADVWQLELAQAPYGLPVQAAGTPVLDAETGAVVAVATVALRGRHRGCVLAVPLGSAAAHPAVADLLARNAATVPAHGRALNLAGVLDLCAATLGPVAQLVADRADRPDGLPAAYPGFAGQERPVLALVGDPGSGRTTELAALALQRAEAAHRLPTVRLRGADLHAEDGSLLDAVGRALLRAEQAVRTGATVATGAEPRQACRVAAAAHRPLLVLLDAPEEMPPGLYERLDEWSAETGRQLRQTGARLVIGCSPEYWEHAGTLFSVEDVHGTDDVHGAGTPPCLRLGPLPAETAPAAALRHHLTPTGPRPAGAPWTPPEPGSWTPTGPGRAAGAAPGPGAADWAAHGPGGASWVPPEAGPSDWAQSGPDPDLGPGAGFGRAAGAASGPGAADGSAHGPSGASWVPPEPGPGGWACFGPGRMAPPGAGGGGRLFADPGLERHPLALRLLAEIRAATPALPGSAAPTRAQLLGARVDLACLRIAERLLPPPPTPPASSPSPGRARAAAQAPASGGGTRRLRAARYLAAAVAGRVHEAARRMLGPGGGTLGRTDFDELFPPVGGWARAVLAEGLLVPAGPGYRFAHEELSEWLQGGHLDLGTALDALLGDGPGLPPVPAPGPRPAPVARGAHRRGGPRGQAVPAPPPPCPPPAPRPLPYHRIGPVREALLRLAEEPDDDPGTLDAWLSRLVLRLDGPDAAPPGSDAYWWSSRLLTSVLLRLPDARPHLPLLRALAERMAYRAAETGEQPLPPAFWTQLPLPVPDLVELLRLPVRGDGPEPLDAVARLIRSDPAAALPALCAWLRDERVAATAVRLLRAHRRIALDDLTEALVQAAHPRADALLGELGVTEPSAMCRAVDRWVHDPRPERHVAAAVHGPAVRAATEADRRLLRFAAEALLARETEEKLHGAALALLVADPAGRERHLPAAVARYAAADPLLRPQHLAPALDTHPAPVLAAFAARLAQPGEEAAAVLLTLGATPAPRAQAAAARLVGDHLARRPESAAQVAAWLDARSRHTPDERATLLPFVRRLAAEQPEAVRAVFAAALAADPAPLGRELLAALRAAEPMRVGDRAHGRL